jgi:hypothetical protein
MLTDMLRPPSHEVRLCQEQQEKHEVFNNVGRSTEGRRANVEVKGMHIYPSDLRRMLCCLQ